jgi:pimeloyl-ACP methyl ester carboxylesterase
VLIALAAVAGGYLALCALVFEIQGRIIFPVGAGVQLPDHRALLLRIPSPTGEVVALHFAAADGAPTVVHFHGNGEELGGIESWAVALNRRGLGVLLVEYPGYGLARSSGPPSEAGCYQAAETALTHLRDRLGVPAGQTILCGHSLGTAVAAEMALRGHGARLVLLSPITSMVDEAHLHFPLLPADLLLRHRFDTLSKATRIGVPTLIVHGGRDELAPVEGGQRLAKAFPAARLVIVPEADHMIIWPREEQLASCVEAFAKGGDCQGL